MYPRMCPFWWVNRWLVKEKQQLNHLKWIESLMQQMKNELEFSSQWVRARCSAEVRLPGTVIRQTLGAITSTYSQHTGTKTNTHSLSWAEHLPRASLNNMHPNLAWALGKLSRHTQNAADTNKRECTGWEHTQRTHTHMHAVNLPLKSALLFSEGHVSACAHRFNVKINTSLSYQWHSVNDIVQQQTTESFTVQS